MSIVKKCCIFCRKELRENSTCQNPECVRYIPDENKETSSDKEEK